MRESAYSKGRRYVTEGRLTVIEVTEHRISAFCKGDGHVYALGYRGNEWWCECPAISRNCSHLIALRLVTVSTKADHDDYRRHTERTS